MHVCKLLLSINGSIGVCARCFLLTFEHLFWYKTKYNNNSNSKKKKIGIYFGLKLAKFVRSFIISLKINSGCESKTVCHVLDYHGLHNPKDDQIKMYFLSHRLQMSEWKHIYSWADISQPSHLPLKAWKMCARKQRVGAPPPHPLTLRCCVVLSAVWMRPLARKTQPLCACIDPVTPGWLLRICRKGVRCILLVFMCWRCLFLGKM